MNKKIILIIVFTCVFCVAYISGCSVNLTDDRGKPDSGVFDNSAGSDNYLTADEARILLTDWVDSHKFQMGGEIEPGYGEFTVDGEEFYSFTMSILMFGIAEVYVNKETGELFHHSSPGNDVFEPLDDWYNREHAAYNNYDDYESYGSYENYDGEYTDVWNEKFDFIFTMPSNWYAFDNPDSGDGYFISRWNMDIRVYGEVDVFPDEYYITPDDGETVSEFIFDSGITGWQKNGDNYVKYFYKSRMRYVTFYVNYESDPDWYDKNSEIFAATAKTLRDGENGIGFYEYYGYYIYYGMDSNVSDDELIAYVTRYVPEVRERIAIGGNGWGEIKVYVPGSVTEFDGEGICRDVWLVSEFGGDMEILAIYTVSSSGAIYEYNSLGDGWIWCDPSYNPYAGADADTDGYSENEDYGIAVG